VALSRDIVIRLQGDADSAIKAQKAAAEAAGVSVTAYKRAEREFAKQAAAVESAARQQRKAMEDVGRATAIAGGAIVAGLGLAIKAAVDWESAWTGVTKTVNGTDAQLAELEDGLRGLARTLPATHTEIAAVAEAAGQLGIQTDNIVDFTRVMINLGETTNLSADEAATSLAQLMNVMQTAPDDVDNLGSTLVALGNAGASTEADIVHMASYISGSARLIGATESDVLALANTLTSMGISAERGGGVMTRVMQDIYAAVQTGGDQLEGFAEVAGMSAQDFAAAFEDDPVRALDSFIQGLNTVEDNGGNVVETLGDLGYVGTQDTAVLLQLKGAGDLLSDSLDLGNQAWEQNVALVQEAAKRYDTTAAKTEMARNAINDAAIDIGDVFLPILASLAETVADVAGWFADLPTPVQNVIGGLAGVAGVGALVGGTFLLLAPRVMDTYKAFQQLSTTSPRAAAGLRGVAKAAGAALAIMAVTSAVDALNKSTQESPPSMEKVTDALLNMGDAATSTGLSDLDVLLAKTAPGIRDFSDAAERLTDPTFTQGLEDTGAAFAGVFGIDSGQGNALRDQISQIGDSLALMVESGNAELAAQQFDTLLQEWEAGGGTQQELLDLMPAYADALTAVDNEQQATADSARLQAEQAQQLAENTDVVYGSLQGYAAALGMSEEATQELIDKSNALGESLGDFVDPLGAYTTLLQEKAQAEADSANAVAESTGAQTTSWEDYVDSVDVTLDEYLARLEQQVADQAAWEQNMLILAGRVSQGTLDELARMGPEGAALVADLVDASDDELARFEDVTASRSKAATDAWGQQLTLAQPVLSAIARVAGQEVVDALATKLAEGTTTVAEIADRYGVNLAGGINPILTALGKYAIRAVIRSGVKTYDAGGYTGPGARLQPAGIVHAGEVVWSQADVAAHGGPGRVDAMRRSRNGYAGGGYVSAGDVPQPPSTAPFGSPISTVADATMQREYDEVRKFLDAHTGGVAGTGAIGGAWGSIWQLVHSAIPEARINSTYRPGDPGYHGLGKAIDFGFGSGPGGAGSAGLASINRFLYDRVGGSLAELIYDGLYDDRPDIKNGRPLVYSASTRAEHQNHVHAAVYDQGGWLKPGLTMAYNGTGRPERVMPSMQVGSGRGGVSVVNVAAPDLRGLIIRGHVTFDANGLATIAGEVVDQKLGEIHDAVEYAGGA